MEKVPGLGQHQKWPFGFDPPSELVVDSIENTPRKVKGRRELLNLEYFFFFISNCKLLKSAKGRNPYTREVYKRTPKRDEQRINLKILHK
jgi:hypothetical protein